MKKQFAFFSTLALVGWCIYRDKKYPLAKGYRLFNKVIFNGNMINNLINHLTHVHSMVRIN